ncbi:MAG TPA: ABC transporter ATP-binding protein [Gemmatimonadaceae bacterium]|jgi:NitT/TauT family transport system ATP-binding protein
MSASPIRFAGVGHWYSVNGGVAAPVLDGIELEVARGEVVAVVGPSGSGKSTLLDLLEGRFPPARGAVYCSPGPASGRMARVYQDRALLPWRTVRENVELPLELLRISNGRKERIDRALERAVVAEFGDFLPGQLSGGLAYRASIARALVTDPEILLLDEPFGSLDEVTTESVMLVLEDVLHECGSTSVFVTHNVEQAVFLSDRVVVLSPRPTKVAGIIDVKRPRPRRKEFLGDASFAECVRDVRLCLRRDRS